METFLRQHALAGRVLEIGCGEALLQRHLSEQAYAEWIGIDISDVAISRAQAFSGERIRYLVSDMEIFEPTGLFDAIIFTESIYYIPNRGRQLMRYARFLQPRGVLIVSVFENNQSPAVWEELHAVAKTIRHATTTNELGMWKCEVLVPREAGR